MLEHPGEPFDVVPFVHGRCKTPIAEIQEAVDGVFSPWQAKKLKVIRGHLDDLDKAKTLIEDLILRLAELFMRQVELFLTVPGISDPLTAIRDGHGAV